MAFLSPEHIENEAINLFDDYCRHVDQEYQPPIPVDAIFESYLGFSLEFFDLQKKHGSTKVLAETHILSKRVIVDLTLDPEEHPENEGRYNFTLAHEIGHWVLHRHEVIAVSATPDLFGYVPEPVVCRSASREPHEWQADQFAANLLMPRKMVIRVWKQFCPLDSLNVYDENQKPPRRGDLFASRTDPFCDIARRMAPIFKVSLTAMQLRLKQLKKLEFEKPQPLLF